MHGEPLNVLCQRTLAVTHAVTFYVRFVINIEAQAVA